MQSQLQKQQKCIKLRASLAEQIKLQHECKETKNITNDNPFAQSESLMALYQREKAKQLYYEQLAIVKQKEDYAKKVEELEKKHSQTRLEQTRQE